MDQPQSVRVNKMELSNDPNSKVKATAEIVISGKYLAKGIKVVEGQKGVFVAMPSMKENGAYQDRFHPITKEAREELNAIVLEAFHKRGQP